MEEAGRVTLDVMDGRIRVLNDEKRALRGRVESLENELSDVVGSTSEEISLLRKDNLHMVESVVD